MKNLTWWFRVVGVFYVGGAVANLAYMLVSPQGVGDTLPYDATADVTAAFNDAWLTFNLDLLVVGAFLLWASRRPGANRVLVWLVVALELGHGVLADAIWIARGYDAASYGAFIVVHLAIAAWGVVALRSASRSSVPQPVAVGV